MLENLGMMVVVKTFGQVAVKLIFLLLVEEEEELVKLGMMAMVQTILQIQQVLQPEQKNCGVKEEMVKFMISEME